jgi:hypothetical protein
MTRNNHLASFIVLQNWPPSSCYKKGKTYSKQTSWISDIYLQLSFEFGF